MNIHSSLTNEGRFLCLTAQASWSESDVRAISDHYKLLGSDYIHKLAVDNQMLPLVANALVTTCSLEKHSIWQSVLDDNHTRVDRLIKVLGGITSTLHSEGRRSAAVEAGGVMLGSHLPTSAYCSGDIDLLVEEGDWERVKTLYEDAGFTNKDRRDRPTTRIEYCKTSDNDEQWLEVGYAPFDRMWIPLNYNDRCNIWLSRTIPSYKSPDISVLLPSDALVFVAFHTSLHSYVRAPGLRLQVDVDRIVRDGDINWSHVVEEVLASGIGTRVYVSLSMAKDLLDTPVPSGVLAKLAPPPLRRQAISYLLQKNGVIVDGTPKLGRAQSILLDLLISERSPPAWLWQIVFPDGDWMQSHFDREGGNLSLWQLHRKRVRALASRWKPE